MKKLHFWTIPTALGLVFGPALAARANLALSLNANASISATSAQLLKKPRSQAGNKVNVWDCDPPLPADAGVHYFLYNLDANDNPLPQNNLVMTMRGARFGPGYGGTLELLVRPGGPGTPTQYVTPSSQTGLYDLAGFQELGLARLTFTRFGQPGMIEEDFDVEVDYDAQDINHQFSNERGFEHARFMSEYVDHTTIADARIARGMMTAVVPASYNGLAPTGQPFVNGFLDFSNGNIASGANVFTATVATDPDSYVWVSTADGAWDEAVRWQDGEIADGSNATARFNGVDQFSVVNVTLNENRFLRALEFGDTVPTSAGGYRLQGSQITLTSATPTITVGELEATSRARLDTVLGGTSGLTITGGNVKASTPAGGLWLTAANTYTGGTTINNATVYLGAPVNAVSAASFGTPASTVTLSGYNFITNATTGAAGGIVLNHDFVATAGSVTAFALGNRADFGNATSQRTVSGSGTVGITAGATGTGIRVYSNFTSLTGRLVFNGSGNIQLYNIGGFVGSGFGNAAVTLDQSAVLAFQTAPGSSTINFGSLAGSSSTAGISPSSSGPAILTIGLLNTNTSFNGFITGTNRVTKTGTGTLTLNGANTYTGTTTVLSGTLAYGSPTAYLPVLGGSGGPPGFNPGGADIRGGRLVLKYAGNASPAAQVKSILTNGFNQSPKFLNGLLRSISIPANRALGWRDDTANSEVHVAFTFYGDADLDFAVNFADLIRLAQNYNLSGKVWDDGDFNYDTFVNFADLIPLAQNYNSSLSSEELGLLTADFAADWAQAMSFVPEPGTISLLGLGAMSVLRRRRE
jgi:autotransporter-associated beta strand protein